MRLRDEATLAATAHGRTPPKFSPLPATVPGSTYDRAADAARRRSNLRLAGVLGLAGLTAGAAGLLQRHLNKRKKDADDRSSRAS